MKINESYTLSDHLTRSNDVWAIHKYRITLKKLKKVFTDSKNFHIYDIGCGSGYFSRKLAADGFTVTAIEPDTEAFLMAATNSGSAGVTWINNEICNLERHQDGDAVIMHDVLEHIDAEGKTVKEVSQLLKPSGLLILSVPASELLFGFHDLQLGHYRRYSKSSLRRALSPEFDIELIRYIGFIGIPVVLLFSKMLKTPYPVGQRGKPSLFQSLFGLALRIEWLFHLPIGSGLIVVARKRS